MSHNAFRGEFPFPFFDGKPGYEMIQPGTCLRFRTGDLARLQTELAPMGFLEITKGVVNRDAKVIFAALRHGLKLEGGDEPYRITQAQLDDLPFAIGTVCDVIDDAFTWAWTGKSRLELRQELAALETRLAPARDGYDTARLDGEEGEADRPFAGSEESNML